MKTRHFIAVLLFFITSVAMSAQNIAGNTWTTDKSETVAGVVQFDMQTKGNNTVKVTITTAKDYTVNGKTLRVSAIARVKGVYTAKSGKITIKLNSSAVSYEYESNISEFSGSSEAAAIVSQYKGKVCEVVDDYCKKYTLNGTYKVKNLADGEGNLIIKTADATYTLERFVAG